MRRGLASLLAIAALALAGCGGGHEHASMTGPAAVVESSGSTSSGPYRGMVLSPAQSVGALSLPDVAHGGAPLRFRPAAGDVLLVFFGFTRCTDVCPTTMANLRAAIQRLPAADRAHVRVAFVTVDPSRDDAATVAAYVRTFLPDGAALRTDDDQALRAVATAFSAAYQVTTADDGTVDVQHTAFVYAVGPDGRVLVQWPDGAPVSEIADDLAVALAASAG